MRRFQARAHALPSTRPLALMRARVRARDCVPQIREQLRNGKLDDEMLKVLEKQETTAKALAESRRVDRRGRGVY